MSPRRNSQRGAGRSSRKPEAGSGSGSGFLGHGLERRETWQGDEWTVRPLAAGRSGGKCYRCPGCDQEIPPGKEHLVAWPEYGGVADRRHWHTSCWDAKDRRSVKPQRSRNAPRY